MDNYINVNLSRDKEECDNIMKKHMKYYIVSDIYKNNISLMVENSLLSPIFGDISLVFTDGHEREIIGESTKKEEITEEEYIEIKKKIKEHEEREKEREKKILKVWKELIN